jgi:cell division septum initiation protein DivIVA
MAALNLLLPVNAQTPAPKLPDSPNQAQPLDPKNPNILRPTTQDSSLLSVAGGQRLMTEASSAVSSQNYPLAVQKLQEARQVFNQMSNFYQELAASFSGIDNRIADSQRQKALETALMRDDATYQLALVHRTQNQPELAVPLLVQIIRSQSPTRELGKKAYQQLVELRFVDAPSPRSGDGSGDSRQRSEAVPEEKPKK